jgi:Domain of unknown function (DUF4142)
MCGIAHLYGVGRGPACVLERLPEAFACLVSRRIISRQQRKRKNQLQSDQYAYAKGGDDPELKKWAGKTLPHLKEHLSMAQKLK